MNKQKESEKIISQSEHCLYCSLSRKLCASPKRDGNDSILLEFDKNVVFRLCKCSHLRLPTTFTFMKNECGLNILISSNAIEKCFHCLKKVNDYIKCRNEGNSTVCYFCSLECVEESLTHFIIQHKTRIVKKKRSNIITTIRTN